MGNRPNAADLELNTLTLRQDGRVLTAYFNQPPHHFVTIDFVRDLDALTRAVDKDPSIGALVLTGTDKNFLTHADPDGIQPLTRLPHLPGRLLTPAITAQDFIARLPGIVALLEKLGTTASTIAWGVRWKRTILRMNRSRVVYIAAINGPTTGGGQEIALACDLRYAENAEHVRMGQIELLAGLIPGGGGTQRLPSIIGLGKAVEYILEGATFSAQEAFDLGIVHHLATPGAVLAAAQETATRLARRSPTAIAEAKRALYFASRKPLSIGLDMELAGFVSAGSTKASKHIHKAFDEDLRRLGASPLLEVESEWRTGTRVDQT
ncbi:enoyl-CoA hydratase [Gordonia effusa NBRC 100432]|uniref:Enoyl-CoA hydratase n=1 Tax=Gordonia effusa NBRC 100432 TaxID=1077974 RepID=H0R021_9ACTN|nr:enoyl-CoA hydratase/isomerase family protein [Gordonia effusa]GAB18422.1 enoyl-CoA hydratase [Gordonia effusa NBRC 100432]